MLQPACWDTRRTRSTPVPHLGPVASLDLAGEGARDCWELNYGGCFPESACYLFSGSLLSLLGLTAFLTPLPTSLPPLPRPLPISLPAAMGLPSFISWPTPSPPFPTASPEALKSPPTVSGPTPSLPAVPPSRCPVTGRFSDC